MSSSKRSSLGINNLRERFEPTKPPPPPRRERVQSALDGPRKAIEVDALKAKEQADAQLSNRVKSSRGRRDVPVVKATDSDRVRELKKAIISKEEEIQSMVKKVNEISHRLDRLLTILYAGAVPSTQPANSTAAKPATLAKSEHSKKADAPAKAPTPKYSKLLSQMR